MVNCNSIREIAERWFLPTSLETDWLFRFCGYCCLRILRCQPFVVSVLTSEFLELNVQKVQSFTTVFSLHILSWWLIFAVIRAPSEILFYLCILRSQIIDIPCLYFHIIVGVFRLVYWSKIFTPLKKYFPCRTLLWLMMGGGVYIESLVLWLDWAKIRNEMWAACLQMRAPAFCIENNMPKSCWSTNDERHVGQNGTQRAALS